MNQNNIILEGIDLVKSYEEDIRAIDGINVSIYEGKITVILGPSGSGKTTLLNILALVDTPDSGKVLIKGKEAPFYSEEEKAKLRNKMFGFVFQFFYLIPELTIEENVMIPLLIRNSSVSFELYRKKARSLLGEFHIENKSKYYPNQLSGGEKQKAAICRALIGEPDIIFADEPTGNLDKNATAEFISLIDCLNKNNKKTFVIATHNESFLKIASDVIYLSNGKIVNRE